MTAERLLRKIEDAMRGLRRKLVRGMASARRRLTRLNLCSYERVHDVFQRTSSSLDVPQAPAHEYIHNVDVHRSLSDVATLAFYCRGRDIELQATGEEEAAKRIHEQFLARDRWTPEHASLYGWDVHGLRHFLEGVGQILQHFGVAYYRIHWDSDDGKRGEIRRIEPLWEDDLREIRIGLRRGRFRYLSRDPWPPNQEPGIEYIPADDIAVFRLEPPFGRRVGSSRLPETKPLVRKSNRLMAASLAVSHAWAYPKDHRCWVERARQLDMSKLIEEQKRIGTKIRSILGGMPILSPEPLTKYYDIWATLKWHWRLARFRESLMGQFNEQIVARFLSRNGLDTQARIEPVVVYTAADWAATISGLESGQIDLDQAAEKLKDAQ